MPLDPTPDRPQPGDGFTITPVGRTWFEERLRAGADWSVVAQLLLGRTLGDVFTWLRPDQRGLIAAVDHDSPGTAGLREVAARALADLMPELEPSSIGAVLFEDITGVAGPDGVLPWPADYSAAVRGSGLHIADSRDAAAVFDAISCVLAPTESFGIVTQVSRPQRFRGWRTEGELAALVADASYAITFGWDGAGIVAAELKS